MKRKTLCLEAMGGWGDMVLTTPLFKAIKDSDKNCRTILFCAKRRNAQIFKHNPYIDSIRPLSIFGSPISNFFFKIKKWNLIKLNYGKFLPSIYPTKHAIEILAEIAGVQVNYKKLQIFLSPTEDKKAKQTLCIYPNPICIQSSSKGENKIWAKHKWEELIRQMPGNTFIQLGTSGDEVLEGAVNLLGKTRFRQAAALIKNSRSFVGIDSSLSHVTNAFDIPGVILFGPSTPQIWGHANNINIYSNPRCSPCADILRYSKCPYGTICMNLITVEEVRQAVIMQLSKSNIS